MSEYSEELCKEKHEAIEEKIATHERRLNDHADRLKKIENENVGTAKDVQNFKNTLEDIKKLIEKMTIQLENLREKPAKRWDNLINQVITVIVGIIIGKFLK
jgi:archaellum component FlaC